MECYLQANCNHLVHAEHGAVSYLHYLRLPVLSGKYLRPLRGHGGVPAMPTGPWACNEVHCQTNWYLEPDQVRWGPQEVPGMGRHRYLHQRAAAVALVAAADQPEQYLAVVLGAPCNGRPLPYLELPEAHELPHAHHL